MQFVIAIARFARSCLGRGLGSAYHILQTFIPCPVFSRAELISIYFVIWCAPGLGEVVLTELAGEAWGAVAGEDAVVGLAGAAVVAGRGGPAQPTTAAAPHRAMH